MLALVVDGHFSISLFFLNCYPEKLPEASIFIEEIRILFCYSNFECIPWMSLFEEQALMEQSL